MNEKFDKALEYQNVIGSIEKKNGLISNISDSVKRNLYRVLGPVAFIAAMTGAPDKANAAISDCGDTMSCVASVNASGQTEFINIANGNVEGSINTNVGSSISSKNRHLTVSGSGGAKIIDVAAETQCTAATGTVARSTMLNNVAYVAYGGNVEKFDLNCTSQGTFLSGQATAQLTNDGVSKVYGIDGFTGDIITHDASTLQTNTNASGLGFADQSVGITYANGGLHLTSAAGIESTTLPSYTTSPLVALPERTNRVLNNGTHLLAKAASGNAAYIIRLSDNNITTITYNTKDIAFSNNNTIYLGGNTGIAEYDLDGTFIKQVSANASEGLAHIPATSTPDVCNDGSITGSEVCDGANLNGATCISQGFDGGTLACATDCATFDTSACTTIPEPFCGDGTINGTETCEATDLNGKTCVTQGFVGGTLACDSNCMGFDTSSCVDQVCGDGEIDGTEECDGLNLNGATCESEGLGSGDLSCNACAFDTSSCEVQPECGNNTKEAGEICDGTDLNGQACEDLGQGFTGGTLACDSNCELDVAGCTTDEICDDTRFADGTKLETNIQITPSRLVGILLDRYETNIANLVHQCEVECTTSEITDLPIMKIKTPDGSYCNFSIKVSNNDQVYQIYDLDAGDGEGAVLSFALENSSGAMLYFGGSMLLHDGNDVNYKIQGSAVGAGTLGTVVGHEILKAHPDTLVPGNWLRVMVAEGGMRYFDTNNPDNYGELLYDPEVGVATALINLDNPGNLADIEKQEFEKKDPTGCGCSVVGSKEAPAGTAIPVLAMLTLLGLMRMRKRKEEGAE
ncbi:hypothetical protein KKD70_03050 [Patescibacteria group bacterium]|nr:hypothetical protein [Patescibacteria group bacterium]